MKANNYKIPEVRVCSNCDFGSEEGEYEFYCIKLPLAFKRIESSEKYYINQNWNLINWERDSFPYFNLNLVCKLGVCDKWEGTGIYHYHEIKEEAKALYDLYKKYKESL